MHTDKRCRIPKQGPVVFVAAPHANQFVDPLLLMRTVRQDARRRIAFLIAEKSVRRPVIGFLSRLVGAVPVGRAMDSKKPGPGKIYLPDPDGDATLVKGSGANFKDDKLFMEGGSLVLPAVNGKSASAEIVEIRSENEIRLKKRFQGELAITQLTGQGIGEGNGHLPGDKKPAKTGDGFEGTSYSVAPHIDQSAVYNFAWKHLGEGGCIGIFPEGGSHDRTELLPLKAGLAIMALGAKADYPDAKVKIVPVGMNYFHAHKFRSRAVIEFGRPIDIDLNLAQQYKTGDRRGPIGQVLKITYERLQEVTVLAPDYETLMLIQAVRRLYNPTNKPLPLSTVIELNRRLMKGYNKFKDDARIVNLRKAVLDYNRTLFRLNIRDHQVSVVTRSWSQIVPTLFYRVLKLILLTVAVIPGVILFAPVFIASHYISRRKAAEALAASTVKIRANDVIATWKILVGLALCPALDLIYTGILVWRTHADRVWGYVPNWVPLWFVTVFGIFFFPAICYAALRFGEVGMDIWKSLRPLWLCLIPGQKNTLDRLRERRAELVDQVNEVINQLGPQLFDDFEKARLISDSEHRGQAGAESPVRSRPSTPTHRRDRSEVDALTFTPSTPPPPVQRSQTLQSHHLPRNESFGDVSRVGIFASRPTTPNRSRSRTNSNDLGFVGGKFGGGLGMTAIDSARDGKSGAVATGKATPSADYMEEVSRNLAAAMRERGKRRRSSGVVDGPWDDEEEEGVDDSEATTTTGDEQPILTPGSEVEEEAKKDI
jgi:glycerol-3-phosphate O-acyltransferase / dihydroxyacetone phosphate acyltransferase